MAAASGIKINGPALRAIRQAMGRTVTDCANEVGVTQGTWSNWEAGRRNAGPKHVQRMAEILLLDDVRAIIWPSATTVVTVAEDAA